MLVLVRGRAGTKVAERGLVVISVGVIRAAKII